MSAIAFIHGQPQPQLNGHGLWLSAFTLADVPAILAGDRDRETAHRLGWAPQDSSGDKVRAYIHSVRSAGARAIGSPGRCAKRGVPPRSATSS